MVPEEIRGLKRWINWKQKRRTKNGQTSITKVPCSETRKPIDITDETNYRTFEEASAASEYIGFVLTDRDPYIVIDLDGCVAEGGDQLDDLAQSIVREFRSYTEYSVSGRGVHIFVRGTLPVGWRRAGGIEVYSEKRFIVMTGLHVPGTPTTIEDRTEQISAWHARLSRTERKRVKTNEISSRIDALEWPDDPQVDFQKFEVLQTNIPKFASSWNRQRAGLADQSASTYCLSLATIAAQAGWDDQEIVNLVRRWRLKHGEEEKSRSWYLKFCLDPARRASQESDPPETEDDALEFLSRAIGTRVIGLVKYLGDPPTFSLRTEGFGEIDLGSVKSLLSFSSFRATMVERIDTLVAPVKRSTWESVVNALLDTVESVDLGTESTEAGFVESLVAEYLAEYVPVEVNDSSILVGDPVYDSETGEVYVQSAHVVRWASRTTRAFGNLSIPARRLTIALKRAGGARSTIHAGGTTRSCWSVPQSILGLVARSDEGRAHPWEIER